MIVLETPRLVLRTWEDADLEPFAALNADPEVMRFFASVVDRAGTQASMDRQRESWEQNRFCLWVVEDRTGAFLGFTGLAVPRFEASFTPCVEIGWRLVRRCWGQGYAPEAAAACLGYAFHTLGLPSVVSFTAAVNQPSRRVMEKLGMVFEGSFDHPSLPEGHALRPHVLFRSRPGDLP